MIISIHVSPLSDRDTNIVFIKTYYSKKIAFEKHLSKYVTL